MKSVFLLNFFFYILVNTFIINQPVTVLYTVLSLDSDFFFFLTHYSYNGLFVQWINSLPNDKILDLSKLKGFADDKIHVTQKLRFASDRPENIVGKGENACYQHFHLFPQCFEFQKAFSSGSL